MRTKTTENGENLFSEDEKETRSARDAREDNILVL